MKFALLVSDFMAYFERPFHYRNYIMFIYVFFWYFYSTFSFHIYISYPPRIIFSSVFIRTAGCHKIIYYVNPPCSKECKISPLSETKYLYIESVSRHYLVKQTNNNNKK